MIEIIYRNNSYELFIDNKYITRGNISSILKDLEYQVNVQGYIIKKIYYYNL